MSKPDLDEKLETILNSNVSGVNQQVYSYKDLMEDTIAQLKEAFREAGYVTPENAQKVQETVNQMANLANDTFHLPTIQYVVPNKAMTKAKHLKTGQAFYDAFKHTIEQEILVVNYSDDGEPCYTQDQCFEAARKAAGLNEVER